MVAQNITRGLLRLKLPANTIMISHGMAGSHLVILFSSTAGQNGENLGSDEEQIVSFVYLLYDLTNNKVRGYLLLHINLL